MLSKTLISMSWQHFIWSWKYSSTQNSMCFCQTAYILLSHVYKIRHRVVRLSKYNTTQIQHQQDTSAKKPTGVSPEWFISLGLWIRWSLPQFEKEHYIILLSFVKVLLHWISSSTLINTNTQIENATPRLHKLFLVHSKFFTAKYMQLSWIIENCKNESQ